MFSLQMQKDLFIFGETIKDYIALLASIRVSGIYMYSVSTLVPRSY